MWITWNYIRLGPVLSYWKIITRGQSKNSPKPLGNPLFSEMYKVWCAGAFSHTFVIRFRFWRTFQNKCKSGKLVNWWIRYFSGSAVLERGPFWRQSRLIENLRFCVGAFAKRTRARRVDFRVLKLLTWDLHSIILSEYCRIRLHVVANKDHRRFHSPSQVFKKS